MEKLIKIPTSLLICRAKCKKTGRWVEGYPLPLIQKEQLIMYLICAANDNASQTGDKVMRSVECYEVEDTTVCKFTGHILNGIKLWQGDIFEYPFQGGIQRYVVSWNDSDMSFCGQAVLDSMPLHKFALLQVNIIGNRFDNPDLMYKI